MAVHSYKKRILYFATKGTEINLKSTVTRPLNHLYNVPHEIHPASIYIESQRHGLSRLTVEKIPRKYQLFLPVYQMKISKR